MTVPIGQLAGQWLFYKWALAQQFAGYRQPWDDQADDVFENFQQEIDKACDFKAVSRLLDNYASGERDFSGIDLSWASLNGVSLPEINFVEGILKGIDLRESNLQGGEFMDAIFKGAKLSGADLSNANLEGANLSHADLSCANLSKSNLTHAILDGVNLKGVNLYQAKGIDNCLASNQGSNADLQWENLNFRSHAEIQIAKALDRAGVLFYPNCRCRLNITIGRGNRESDFLVFHQGKWGILEVDGEHWHPPCRAVEDHERDRLFKAHGILFVEHYDADRCSEKPNEVVQEFLQILSWTAQH